MLIAAIPKSGSTALMETLGRVHRLEYKQLSYEDLELHGQPFDDNVKPLWLFHGDLSDIHESQLTKIVGSRSTFYKQHIAPSVRNLDFLKDTRIIVLLRDPQNIIESYYRGFEKNIHSPPVDFCKNGSMNDWKKYAEECGLRASLEWWLSTWKSNANPNWLFIDFFDITQQPAESIRKIENHLQLESSGTKKLVKARYSKSLFIPYRYNRKWRDRVMKLKNIKLFKEKFKFLARKAKSRLFNKN